MSVLIEGMEMPDTCTRCDYIGLNVAIGCKVVTGTNGRADNCPLTEVPEPHGRLIDADALHKLFEDQWHYLQVLDWNENPTAEANQSGINWCINTMHDDAPTIIPASEEGEA